MNKASLHAILVLLEPPRQPPVARAAASVNQERTQIHKVWRPVYPAQPASSSPRMGRRNAHHVLNPSTKTTLDRSRAKIVLQPQWGLIRLGLTRSVIVIVSTR